MILYVNGDSHAAAAEAVNSHAWACDDGNLYGTGKEPHPDNNAVSFGQVLANQLGWQLVNQSQAGGSNQRIIRTTRDWLDQQPRLDQIFVLIQWSTWEREEWLYRGEYYQVNASGTDHVPESLADYYKQFVANIDWNTCTKQAHDQIWKFHQELKDLGVPHLFFNGNNDFSTSQNRMDWSKKYVGPYDPNMTFDRILRNQGFDTVRADSWHFGAEAHCFWARYLLQYMCDNQLIGTNEISTD